MSTTVIARVRALCGIPETSIGGGVLPPSHVYRMGIVPLSSNAGLDITNGPLLPILMIPALTKSRSETLPSAHHPASVFTQEGIWDGEAVAFTPPGITISPRSTRYWIPLMKSSSPTKPSDHHLALFFTHEGT